MQALSPVTDLDERRLDKFAAERQTLTARLAALDAREVAFRRRWSDANGYRVLLSPEQIRRAMAAKAAAEGEAA